MILASFLLKFWSEDSVLFLFKAAITLLAISWLLSAAPATRIWPATAVSDCRQKIGTAEPHPNSLEDFTAVIFAQSPALREMRTRGLVRLKDGWENAFPSAELHSLLRARLIPDRAIASARLALDRLLLPETYQPTREKRN
jgi:hypothetical protein